MTRIKWSQEAQNMIGKTYKRLTVIGLSSKPNTHGHIHIDCICSCGVGITAQANNVYSGNTKSCGCWNVEQKDELRTRQKLEAQNRALKLVGRTFGALSITSLSDKKFQYGHAYVKANCSCGKKDVDIAASSIRGGRNITCGCRILGGKKDKRYAKDPRLSSAKRVYSRYKDGNISFDDFLKLSQEDCFYCGAAPSNRCNMYPAKQLKGIHDISNGWFIYSGLDRIDSNKVHDIDNVVPCCIDCNKAKMKRTTEDFFSWIERVYNKHSKRAKK